MNRLILQGLPIRLRSTRIVFIDGPLQKSPHIVAYLATVRSSKTLHLQKLLGMVQRVVILSVTQKDLPTSPLAPPRRHRGKFEKNRRSMVPHITGRLVNSTPEPFFSLLLDLQSLPTPLNCPSCVEFSRATSASCPTQLPASGAMSICRILTRSPIVTPMCKSSSLRLCAWPRREYLYCSFNCGNLQLQFPIYRILADLFLIIVCATAVPIGVSHKPNCNISQYM
jgi:hypothetical protein